MTGEPIDLEELIAQIRAAWPDRYCRGRILHVHKNALKLPAGSVVHLRILIQAITPADPAYNGTAYLEDI